MSNKKRNKRKQPKNKTSGKDKIAVPVSLFTEEEHAFILNVLVRFVGLPEAHEDYQTFETIKQKLKIIQNERMKARALQHEKKSTDKPVAAGK